MEQKKRLCSEIRLFDICERESCADRDGKYCTNTEMLRKFEVILSEEDERPPQQYLDEEYDEVGEEDEYGYGDSFANDDYEQEDEE